jgi:hypothetical protein
LSRQAVQGNHHIYNCKVWSLISYFYTIYHYEIRIREWYWVYTLLHWGSLKRVTVLYRFVL